MAKQIAWLCCPVIGTYGDVTYYEMDGQYYARKKSSLSGKRVKTSPQFRLTMVHAHLFKRASKVGAQVYKALPPGWRQFWMYRSFTGEAYTMLIENPYNDEEVKEILWKCYVEPWEQRKIIDPGNPIFQPKPKKIRKRRKYSEESIKRMLKRKDKNGKPKFIDPEEEERKRLRKEMNAACYARTIEKQRRLAEEQLQAEEKLQATSFGPGALENEEPASPLRKTTRLGRRGQRSRNKLISPLAGSQAGVKLHPRVNKPLLPTLQIHYPTSRTILQIYCSIHSNAP